MCLSLVLFFLCVCGRSAAETYDLSTPAGLTEWVTHYYEHKDTASVVTAIREMFRQGAFDEQDAQAAFAAGFLSMVFARNPDKIDAWFEELEDLTLAQKRYLWIALNFSKSPAGQQTLEKIREKSEPGPAQFIGELLAQAYLDILETPIDNTGALEVCWGSFFAGGDERYIVKIIGTLSGLSQPYNGELGIQDPRAIAESARVNLMYDAVRHPRILEICKREMELQPQEVREALAEIVAKAGQENKVE
ncbi:MAG: hypothetical protein PHR11_05185 [Candidatus Omnitrophica bacterium]|nr:hypothetical protein [Candidatus Omnitrophota bacterium]